MPNISKIKLPNENTARELKDSTARAVFTPATSSASGTQGQVPAPTYSEVTAGKFLKADGTWDTPAGGTTPTGDDIVLTGYTQGSDTSAVAATDKVNEAIAKHENKIATNQTNILYTQDMICDNEFSTSTAYAVGDIVTYEHGLYKFTSAHSAGAWNSAEVEDITTTDMIASKISASDYGSQSTGGTVRVWTTTVGTDTVLHISNQAAT